MATKGRISLAVGKSVATAQSTESNAPVNFERIYVEGFATSADAALATDHLAAYLRSTAPSIEMGINGSVLAIPYLYQVASARQALITEIEVIIADIGIDSAWSQFGGIAALTNGLTAVVDDGAAVPTTLLDLTDGSPWKRTADLLGFSSESLFRDSAAGVDVLSIRMRLGQDLYLTAGQRLVVTVRDDLSTLDALRMRVLGINRSADAV